MKKMNHFALGVDGFVRLGAVKVMVKHGTDLEPTVLINRDPLRRLDLNDVGGEEPETFDLTDVFNLHVLLGKLLKLHDVEVKHIDR